MRALYLPVLCLLGLGLSAAQQVQAQAPATATTTRVVLPADVDGALRDATNAARAQAGAPALKTHPALRTVAAQLASDMAAKDEGVPDIARDVQKAQAVLLAATQAAGYPGQGVSATVFVDPAGGNKTDHAPALAQAVKQWTDASDTYAVVMSQTMKACAGATAQGASGRHYYVQVYGDAAAAGAAAGAK